MKTPRVRLASVVFPEVGQKEAGTYSRLAAVLNSSARDRSPNTPIDFFDAPTPPSGDRGRQGLVDNTQKMLAWNEIAQQSEDGEILGLLDCDTMVINDCSCIADLDFDVTWTVRSRRSQFPFNSGVVFARISPKVKEFFERWKDANVRLLEDSKSHEPLRRVYGGINQASLGEMLVRGPGVNMQPLDCWEWNCEDSSWPDFDEKRTKIVHVKSGLRKAVLGKGPTDRLDRLVQIWRRYDRAAQDEAMGLPPGVDPAGLASNVG